MDGTGICIIMVIQLFIKIQLDKKKKKIQFFRHNFISAEFKSDEP